MCSLPLCLSCVPYHCVTVMCSLSLCTLSNHHVFLTTVRLSCVPYHCVLWVTIMCSLPLCALSNHHVFLTIVWPSCVPYYCMLWVIIMCSLPLCTLSDHHLLVMVVVVGDSCASSYHGLKLALQGLLSWRLGECALSQSSLHRLLAKSSRAVNKCSFCCDWKPRSCTRGWWIDRFLL